MKLIVFTDMDGTILDFNTYSYEESLPAIRYLKQYGIPIVLCSAKTISEIMLYQRELDIADPFIAENGSVIKIPKGYFKINIRDSLDEGNKLTIELGLKIDRLKEIIKLSLQRVNVNYKFFTEMSIEEIAADSSLPLEQARLARERLYSETIKIIGGESEVRKALKALMEAGLNCSYGGRYIIVNHGSNKGYAVQRLTELYRREYGEVITCAFGDSKSDESMLKAVDIPILVKNAFGNWTDIEVPNLIKIDDIGPRGFKSGVEKVLHPIIERLLSN